MLEKVKNLLEKQISNIVEVNDLTDLQTYGCCFGLGIVVTLLTIWIF